MVGQVEHVPETASNGRRVEAPMVGQVEHVPETASNGRRVEAPMVGQVEHVPDTALGACARNDAPETARMWHAGSEGEGSPPISVPLGELDEISPRAAQSHRISARPGTIQPWALRNEIVRPDPLMTL